jgi:DNA-binding transcriptional ArsR family regulator
MLGVFQSAVRVEILRILVEFEFRSLSDIASILERRGWKMTLSGVLKHMRELEGAGLVKHEPGIFSEAPDARKTMYFLEGRERVEQMLQRLEADVVGPLTSGLVFSETGRLARGIEGMRRGPIEKEKNQLESLLVECESERVYKHLTEDEKKKLKLWRMMLSVM